MKEFKPHKNDNVYTTLQNERYHNQKLVIRKEKLLENNIQFDDLVKPDLVKPQGSAIKLK